MTDPGMCWSEQISPLAHSSQATWQPFNLSHCIEMHNTHLLGCAGQLSQTYFTHSAPILTPLNQSPTVNRHCPPLRESRYVTSHSLQHQPKNGNCHDERYISWYKCSLQVDTNPILYFYCAENVEILVIWNAIHEFVAENLMQLWWNAADMKPFLFPVKPQRGLAYFNTESIVCCLAQCVIWQFCCIIKIQCSTLTVAR